MSITTIQRSNLKPFIKWPGGKTKELRIIFDHLPEKIETYYEPFIGGGATYLAMPSVIESFCINDLSSDLINLYRQIKNQQSNNFIALLKDLNKAWMNLDHTFIEYYEASLSSLFLDYRDNKKDLDEIKRQCASILNEKFIDAFSDYPNSWWLDKDWFQEELVKTVPKKLSTMKNNEKKKQAQLSIEDVKGNILTSLKQSFYAYMRHLLNYPEQYDLSTAQYTCVYYFIRNFCYSSMFRYNSSGKFNVPYGGMSYNKNNLSTKIQYISSPKLQSRLKETTIENLDFYEFMKTRQLNDNDFVFLDPPYDSDFSTYDQNAFAAKDQIRLSKYLIEEASCKWMVVIKNTDFIHSLYEGKPNVTVQYFGKKYGVSFMNRNERAVTHLIITNYDTPANNQPLIFS